MSSYQTEQTSSHYTELHKEEQPDQLNHSKSTAKRLCTLLISVPLLVTLIVGVVLIYKHSSSSPSPSPPFDPPMSDGLRNQIRKYLNVSADPCNDFYEFACGNWIDNFNLSGANAYDLSFNSIEEVVSKQYADILDQDFDLTRDVRSACLNTTVLDMDWQSHLKPWLDLIAQVNTSKDLFTLLGNMHAHGLAKYTLFYWQIQGDLTNASSAWFTFIPGGTTLSADDYANNTRASMYSDQVLKAYFQILQSAGFVSNAAQAASNVLAAEQWINTRSVGVPQDSAVQVAQVQVETLASFETKYNLPISSYQASFSSVGSSFNTLQFFGDSFYKNLSVELMNSSSSVFNPAAARDFLRWRLVFGVLDFLPQSFRAISNTLFSVFNVRTPDSNGPLFYRVDSDKQFYIVDRHRKKGPTATKASLVNDALNQTTACRDMLSNNFLNYYEQQWILKDFPPQNKGFAISLVQLIRSQFLNRLNTVTWIDDQTRAAAINKLNNIIDNVAYDDTWTNYTMQFNATNAFANYLKINVFNNNKTLSNADKPVNRNRFSNTLALTVQNAFYDPNTNTINMLAGLMYPPFFSQNYPMMLNLAAYGMVIGHELTHGFDNNGRLFGPTGAYVDWWTAQSAANFQQRASCLVQQYGSYNLSSGAVNGSHTLGENIADNGGINLAFNAYQSFMSTQADQSPKLPGFTNDQLFFLYFAQSWCWKANVAGEKRILANEHSPPPFRVQGSLSNTIAFANAFGCSNSSVYGRSLTSNRCEVW